LNGHYTHVYVMKLYKGK